MAISSVLAASRLASFSTAELAALPNTTSSPAARAAATSWSESSITTTGDPADLSPSATTRPTCP
jgi:ABC-type transport system substrate-binding protein